MSDPTERDAPHDPHAQAYRPAQSVREGAETGHAARARIAEERHASGLFHLRTALVAAARRLMACGGRPPCALCDSPAEYEGLCRACHEELPWLPADICPRCAESAPNGDACGRCLAAPRAFDAVLPGAEYRFPLDAMIHRFKFGGALWLAPVLAGVLIERVAASPRPDALLPMPLSDRRRAERGFNQSSELARFIARALDLPLRLDVLRRARDTVPQTSLPRDAREANVRGAFVVDRPVQGLRLALVDDVMTTGSTAGEAARALRACGARQVDIWVVARTWRHDRG